MNRRQLLIGTLALAVGVPGRAGAAVQPFDAKAFAAAQDAGHGIVVHVHAPW
jgi:hypothetical protein